MPQRTAGARVVKLSDVLRRESATPLVKICCISSRDEADLAIAAGADLLGLVSAMPSGPGVIEDTLIEAIVAHVGARAATVLLTSRTTSEGISEQLERVRPSVLQLCDAVPDEEFALLRTRHADTVLMPVVHVEGAASVDVARTAARHGDAVLLDSGRPSAAVRELGGTGRVHDWDVSRDIREAIDRPLLLAGGLNPDNVAAAIRHVQPAGVDVCSGVRVNARLDRHRLDAFVAAVRGTS